MGQQDLTRIPGSAWPGRVPEPKRAWLGFVVGVRGRGKSYRACQVLNFWRASRAGLSVAVDPVSPVPPVPSYPSFYADGWASDLDGLLVEDKAAPLGQRLPRGVNLVVVDEADRWLKQGRVPHPMLFDLTVRGRHRGVSMMLLTQRPAMLEYTCWAQMGQLVSFTLTARRDRARVAEQHPDLEDMADLLPYLPVGVAVEWSINEGVMPGRVELLRELRNVHKVKLPRRVLAQVER